MIIFKIDDQEEDQYIYQQIYKNLKRLILDRKVTAGEKLPSKRQLATDVNVSVNSVATAYDQLIAEGYIHAVERSGYYVEEITQFVDEEEKEGTPDFPEELKEERGNEREDTLSLSHMATDLSLFPFNEWLKCEKTAFKNHMEDMSHISHPQGPYLVRETLSRMISLNRGVSCEPEQIVVGPGTQPLIRQVINMMEGRNTVAIENPGYHRMYELFNNLGMSVYPLSLDDSGIDIEAVREINPNFLFITPSHQFPTGSIMPISRRIELLNWASEANDRYIIEDDYDSEFKYGTDNIPSLQSLDRNNRVIYAGTFSKTLTSSLRISYLVLPPKLLKKYRENYSTWIQGSSVLNLYTLHYFIENGEYARHLKRLNAHYERIRKTFLKELKKRFKNSIEIYDIPAGLHCYAEFKTDKTYEEIKQAAEAENLELYTRLRFKLDKEEECRDKKGIILGFAKLREEEIEKAVGKLERVM